MLWEVTQGCQRRCSTEINWQWGRTGRPHTYISTFPLCVCQEDGEKVPSPQSALALALQRMPQAAQEMPGFSQPPRLGGCGMLGKIAEGMLPPSGEVGRLRQDGQNQVGWSSTGHPCPGAPRNEDFWHR